MYSYAAASPESGLLVVRNYEKAWKNFSFEKIPDEVKDSGSFISYMKKQEEGLQKFCKESDKSD